MGDITEAWRVITHTTKKNRFEKCDFSNDCVSSYDDSAVKLCEVEDDDRHSLQPLVVQSEGYSSRDCSLKGCGVFSVNHVVDQHLTRPEKESEAEEDVAEHKATSLDALKGLEAARKYICQFVTKKIITVMCNEVENELYRLSV
jgi:hypothetical protein